MHLIKLFWGGYPLVRVFASNLINYRNFRTLKTFFTFFGIIEKDK